MDFHHGLHAHFGSSGHHHHGQVSANSSRAPVIIQGAALSIFMVFELTVGVLAHSVALVGDSFHMLVDVGSAFVSAWVIGLLRRPASDSHTFAYRRADVLMAQGQGVLFVVMALLTVWEGAHRLMRPEKVNGTLVMAAAAIGILASLGILWVLNRSRSNSMTFKANWLHEIQDLSGFLSTAIAGLLVWFSHLYQWDAIASFVVAGIMFSHGWEVLRESGEILMESVPDGMNLETIREFIEGHALRPEIKNLHLWAIDGEYTSMSVQIYLEDEADCHLLQAELHEYADSGLGISHVTVDVMHRPGSSTHPH